jgi:hypothetical protein
MVDNPFCILVSPFSKKIRNVVLPDIGTWEEVFFILVLLQNLKEILRCLKSSKDLTFTDHDILLKIV